MPAERSSTVTFLLFFYLKLAAKTADYGCDIILFSMPDLKVSIHCIQNAVENTRNPPAFCHILQSFLAFSYPQSSVQQNSSHRLSSRESTEDVKPNVYIFFYAKLCTADCDRCLSWDSVVCLKSFLSFQTFDSTRSRVQFTISAEARQKNCWHFCLISVQWLCACRMNWVCNFEMQPMMTNS